MAIALGLIVVRLVDVQAIEGDHYEAMAEAQRVRTVSLAAERGSIFDRNGHDLALSVPQHTIYADPRLVRDPARYASKLAPIVDVDRSDLRDRLAAAGHRVRLRRPQGGRQGRAAGGEARAARRRFGAGVEALLPRRPARRTGHRLRRHRRRRPQRARGRVRQDAEGQAGQGRDRGGPERPGDPRDPAHRRARTSRRRPRAHARPVAPVRGGEAARRPGRPHRTRGAGSRSSPT